MTELPAQVLRDFVTWAYGTGMRFAGIQALTWAGYNRETRALPDSWGGRFGKRSSVREGLGRGSTRAGCSESLGDFSRGRRSPRPVAPSGFPEEVSAGTDRRSEDCWRKTDPNGSKPVRTEGKS